MPPQRRPALVTLREVAARSGVSIATASRALAGDTAISEPTRLRVAEAAQHLSYRPNAGARSLRTRSSMLIGVLVPTSGDGYYGEVVAAIEHRSRQLGYQVLLAMSHFETEREHEALETFLSQRVDAVISVSPIGPEDAMGISSAAMLTSVIINWDVAVRQRLVDRVASGADRGLATSVAQLAPVGPNHVRFDDTAGAATATRHLVQSGHRQFVFVCGAVTRSSVLRLLGFRQTLSAAGLWPQPVIQPAEATLAARQQAVADFLRTARPPLAVVAYDDLTAIAAIRAAHEAGWSVPSDVSVVGIDDIELAQYTWPSLTTVAQPKAEIGALAVEAVLGARRRAGQLLEGTLIKRESTAEATSTATSTKSTSTKSAGTKTGASTKAGARSTTGARTRVR